MRDSTDRSGGAAPNHALPVRRRHGDRHRLADLVGREHQVVLDLRLRQPEVRQPVVAHVLRRMAGQAVVDEVARAALQRLLVEAVDRRGREAEVGAARQRERRRGRDAATAGQAGKLVHLPRSPCSGTGLVLSRAVYHGISRKNRK